jgi:RHS repeat-associated protein
VLDPNGQVKVQYVYGPHSIAPTYLIKDNAKYKIQATPLGSIQYVIDATGTVVQDLKYDEYGVILVDSSVSNSSNEPFQVLGFNGGLTDRDTGLIRFGARDYDPTIGRWTAKDPIGFAGGDTNLYSYVGQNPTSFIDPAGLMKLPNNPKDLPPGWELDPSHKDPNGERWRYKKSKRYLDFHKGRSGQSGWKGKDHWHDSECPDDHKEAGDEVSDPVEFNTNFSPSDQMPINIPLPYLIPYLLPLFL